MARIVLVHGAFNELWGPHELKARWLPALRDGLWHHGVEIADDDVAVCFYGDLFRLAPGADADVSFARTRAGIADALSNLGGADGLGALAQAASDEAFDRTVDMVTVMATTPDLRQQMRARAEAVIGPDTTVIVAHSLGTVLSYMALCNVPDLPVRTLVTLGSPLASPMIFDHLDPAPVDGVGRWPGGLDRWVNVRAVGDKAAAVSLRERFGDRIEEALVDNGHRAHAPEPYLNSEPTGAAIARALGA
jgi:predicted alpha/beta hydrolase family esterase